MNDARPLPRYLLMALVGAVLAGFLVRWLGTVEGILPAGGLLPVLGSSVLCFGLWMAAWGSTRSLYAPLRLVLAALIPFIIGATAGVVWAAYAVAPGAAFALLAVGIRVAMFREGTRPSS